MQICPAIDLRNGHCVRLYQGDFAQETQYSADPFAMIEQFVAEGANWLHVIDLDAAKDPQQHQYALILSLLKHYALNVQMGGGIRSSEQIKQLLDGGVTRIIIGSQAVKNSSEVKNWFRIFGKERIVLAVDMQYGTDNQPYVAVQAWQQLSQYKLTDLIDFYAEVAVKHVLCTDISRDGTLQGPNVTLYENLMQRFPNIKFQASGGIANLTDIKILQEKNLSGAVIGRALYENKFKLREAIGIINIMSAPDRCPG